MKTIHYSMVLGCCMALLSTACTAPKNPPNNALDKGHEDPSKVVFKFTPGNVLQVEEIDGISYGKGFTPLSGVEPQEYILDTDRFNQIHAKGELNLVKGQWYKLDIGFFNLAGVDIAPQFVANETQRGMHQFFFRAYEGPETTTVLKNIYSYLYGDLQPDGQWYRPPIGFTGFFKVNDNDAVLDSTFLDVVLVHVLPPRTKLQPKTGKPHTFDNPGKLALESVLDIHYRIPLTALEAKKEKNIETEKN